MRAVVVSSDRCSEIAALTPHQSLCSASILDRPYIDHLVSFLKHHGITSVDFVFTAASKSIEIFLEEKKRAGYPIPLRFHAVADAIHAYQTIKTLDFSDEEGPILLGHDEQLPDLAGALIDRPSSNGGPRIFCQNQDVSPLHKRSTIWIGWAVVSIDSIRNWPDRVDRKELAAHLLSQARFQGRIVSVKSVLNLQSHRDYLDAHRCVMDKKIHGAKISGSEKENKLWVGKQTHIDPTALLVPPAYIGEGCHIGPGIRIGPYVSVGKGCRIEGHCLVEEAVVLPGSFVGEALELSGVIVEGDRLINARLGTEVRVTDRFILSRQSDRKIGHRIIHGVVRSLAPFLRLIRTTIKPRLNK
ncbi:MAG: hypothetical protein KJ645_06500 [Planctomycetes bacterium]|nr:hypothetical protein [Planctomycetota bacterium]